MHPKHQAESRFTSWNEFCRVVLEIIAEQSPCAQPTLFLIAISRGLQSFGDGSLGELKKLLGRCVQELKARGLVQLDGERLVLTPARSTEDEDILELTAELELQPPKRDEAPTNQTRTDSPKRVGEPRTEEMIAAHAGTPKDEGILDLTPELELHPSPRLSMRDEVGINRTQRAREPTREEIIAAPAGSAAEEDILDLTAELEIRPSPRSSQRDEALPNRTQRAREPTREEIIAAMRQFILDE